MNLPSQPQQASQEHTATWHFSFFSACTFQLQQTTARTPIWDFALRWPSAAQPQSASCSTRPCKDKDLLAVYCCANGRSAVRSCFAFSSFAIKDYGRFPRARSTSTDPLTVGFSCLLAQGPQENPETMELLPGAQNLLGPEISGWVQR